MTDAVRSVERAINVLSVLVRSSRPLGPTEIAERLQLPVPTVHRLLTSLAATNDMVRQTPGGTTYEPGLGFLTMGLVVLGRSALMRRAHPLLVHASSVTGHRTFLSLRAGRYATFLDSVPGSDSAVKADFYPGVLQPAHTTAAGRVLLAGHVPAELDRVFQGVVLEPFADGASLSLNALKAELNRVRNDGFAEDVGRSHTNWAGTAVPVADREGRTAAALSSGFWTDRPATAELASIRKVLYEVADLISPIL